jgi:hypothetical protein
MLVAPAILLLGFLVAADMGWAELRDRRARRRSTACGATLTRRFALPPPR